MTFILRSNVTQNRSRSAARQRGVAAILAMMFLVIFASLAAAMAVVSQGNLRVADTNIKISRSLAAAETGMNLMIRQLEKVTNGDPLDFAQYPGIKTTAGVIQDEDAISGSHYASTGNAYALWGGDSGQPTTADPFGTIAGAMIAALRGDSHYKDLNEEPRIVSLGVDEHGRYIKQLYIPKIKFYGKDVSASGEDNSLTFEVRMTPHPLPLDMQPSNSGYNDPYYDRMPFGDPNGSVAFEDIKREAGLDFVVGESDPFPAIDPVIKPLDARFIRVTVTAIDGGAADGDSRVARSISHDFMLGKRVPYAILSNSRLMLGRNVSVKGNVASRFVDAGKINGNPVQVQSDLYDFHSGLDADLNRFYEEVKDVTKDIDGDNRLNLQSPIELAVAESSLGGGNADKDGDGYITEFDYLLKHFDSDSNQVIRRQEFIDDVLDQGKDEKTAEQLFDLLDQAGSALRPGYDDGELNSDDLVSKIQGSVSTMITQNEWENGYENWHTGGDVHFKSDLQGTYLPGFGGTPLQTGDPKLMDVFDIDQNDFNTKVFMDIVGSNVVPIIPEDGSPPTLDSYDNPNTLSVVEVAEWVAPSDAEPTLTRVGTPFGSVFAYDQYFRPTYRNMVFEDVRVPLGLNAKFENCLFKGVTFIEVIKDNGDENFNRAGMFADSITFDKTHDYDPPTWKWGPDDFTVMVGGVTVENTKPFGNNIHFHDCVFQGSIASGTQLGEQPEAYTHVRNKVTFTGRTKFDHEAVTDPEKRRFYERSSLLLPHISVELGSFDEGYSSDEVIDLTGAIVAGVIDMRGQVSIRGTLIATFFPIEGQAPVEEGNTPNFNVTLGYFSQDAGDLEAASGPRASQGLGKIRIVYDPSLALPDGINSPIEIRPLRGSYSEGAR
ncbi:MAG: hypothetical protein V3V20_07585 [Algisphaera sp.]